MCECVLFPGAGSRAPALFLVPLVRALSTSSHGYCAGRSTGMCAEVV